MDEPSKPEHKPEGRYPDAFTLKECAYRFMFPANTKGAEHMKPVCDVAWLYLQSLARARLPVYAISYTDIDLIHPTSRWYRFRSLFAGRVIATKFVNIVVAIQSAFELFHTQAAALNVLITGPWPSPGSEKLSEQNRLASRKWDDVIVQPGLQDGWLTLADPNVQVVEPVEFPLYLFSTYASRQVEAAK